MADDTLTFTLDTGDGEGGDVVIKLRPDLAPGHVARITELANEGFYDGVVFHRVIPGFMAQGGDPSGTGMGGSDENSCLMFGLDEPEVPVPVGSPPWAMKPGITRWNTTPS